LKYKYQFYAESDVIIITGKKANVEKARKMIEDIQKDLVGYFVINCCHGNMKIFRKIWKVKDNFADIKQHTQKRFGTKIKK
jgi:hypothetical protein